VVLSRRPGTCLLLVLRVPWFVAVGAVSYGQLLGDSYTSVAFCLGFGLTVV
jgi:hypothetical protein